MNLLKEYTILSVLRIPFFVVKTQDEFEEIQASIWFRLRKVKGIKIIKGIKTTALEVRAWNLCDETNERPDKKHKLSIKNICIITRFLLKHLILRIAIKKQITEEEIISMYNYTINNIEMYREKLIKHLVGIK